MNCVAAVFLLDCSKYVLNARTRLPTNNLIVFFYKICSMIVTPGSQTILKLKVFITFLNLPFDASALAVMAYIIDLFKSYFFQSERWSSYPVIPYNNYRVFQRIFGSILIISFG